MCSCLEANQMKEIILKFKTVNGEEAYHLIDAEGKRQPFKERQVAKAVAKDKIISKNPLVVKVKIRVRRLAVAVELDKKIVEALRKAGAKENTDYDMEVVW